MKLVYQSAFSPENPSEWPMPGYASATSEHLDGLKRKDVEIHIQGLKGRKEFDDTKYSKYVHEGHFLYNMWFTYMRAGGVLNQAIQAQGKAYDGIMLGEPMEPITHVLRELIDIPILSITETSVHVACMLGNKLALITHFPKYALWLRKMVHDYGLERKVAYIGCLELSLKDDLRAFEEPSATIDQFISLSREAIKAGAEVIVPPSASMDLILMKNGVKEVEGAVVLDTVGTLLKITEAMVDLRKAGITYSRKSLYRSPSKERVEDSLKGLGFEW